MVGDNSFTLDIKRRINLASQRLGMMRTIAWRSRELNLKTKVDLLVSCVFSCLLYATETWILKAEVSRRILAFDMRLYRRLLKVCWKDKVSNDRIRKIINRQIALVDVIKRRKLQLFGNIFRMSDNCLVKMVMLGMTDSNRPQGRPARQ